MLSVSIVRISCHQRQGGADREVGGDVLHDDRREGLVSSDAERSFISLKSAAKNCRWALMRPMSPPERGMPFADELLRLDAREGVGAGGKGNPFQRKSLVDGDGDAADGVDNRDKPVHIDGHIVVDRDQQPVIDDLRQPVDAGEAVNGVDLAGCGDVGADPGIPGNLQRRYRTGLQVDLDDTMMTSSQFAAA